MTFIINSSNIDKNEDDNSNDDNKGIYILILKLIILKTTARLQSKSIEQYIE